MAKTGEVLLGEFSDFLGDRFASTTTAAGASDGSTLVDSLLKQFSEDVIEGWFLRIDEPAHGALHEIRRITSHADATGTENLASDFSAQLGSGITYELHRYDPARKFAALDRARLKIADDVFVILRDETITGDGRNNEFRTPTAFSRGPSAAVIEDPLEVDAVWNLLENPRLSATTSWTAAAGLAAETFSRNSIDDIIPRHEQTCLKLTYTTGGSDGTLTQVVGDMASDFSAGRAAGRVLEAGIWVYSLTAGLFVEIVHDTASFTSTAHQGFGWEFLRARGEVPQGNSTLLSVRIRFPSGTSAVAYAERAWLVYDNIPDFYYDREPVSTLYDNSLKRFWFDRGTPPRGHQIRLFGREPVTALGTVLSAAASNEMEVDDASSQILYAEAARVLLGDDVMNSEDLGGVAERIAWVEREHDELAMKWPFVPNEGRIRGPYGR